MRIGIPKLVSGERLPKGWAVAYTDFTKDEAICLPIPLHWIARWGHRLYWWIVWPRSLATERAFALGKDAGREEPWADYVVNLANERAQALKEGRIQGREEMRVELTPKADPPTPGLCPECEALGTAMRETWNTRIYRCSDCACEWEANDVPSGGHRHVTSHGTAWIGESHESKPV